MHEHYFLKIRLFKIHNSPIVRQWMVLFPLSDYVYKEKKKLRNLEQKLLSQCKGDRRCKDNVRKDIREEMKKLDEEREEAEKKERQKLIKMRTKVEQNKRMENKMVLKTTNAVDPSIVELKLSTQRHDENMVDKSVTSLKNLELHDEQLDKSHTKEIHQMLEDYHKEVDYEHKMNTAHIQKSSKDNYEHRQDILRLENARVHDLKVAHRREMHTIASMQSRIDKLVHDQQHPSYNYGHHTTLCDDIEHMLVTHPSQCSSIKSMYQDAHCCGLEPPVAPPELVGIEVGVIVMTTMIMLATTFFVIYYSIKYCACCACCKCCACCYCDKRRRRRKLPKGYTNGSDNYFYDKL